MESLFVRKKDGGKDTELNARAPGKNTKAHPAATIYLKNGKTSIIEEVLHEN